MLRVGILASGENEIVREILDKFGDYVGAVICKSSGDDEILEAFEKGGVNFIVLADYTRRVSDEIISKYPGRIINIHPSLLPKFGGKGMYGQAVHEAVIRSDDKKGGATIHVVEGDYDVGEIIAQREINIDGDDVDSLSRKVLGVEKELVCEVLQTFINRS